MSSAALLRFQDIPSCLRCWCGCRRADHSAVYAHGIVKVPLSPSDAKEVAIEERDPVVATRPAYAVGTAGGPRKRTAREVANRRDIEPVELACRQDGQENVQPGHFDLEFDIPEPATAGRGNDRRCCGAAGDQRAACVKQGGAASNFPGRPGNDSIIQIIGEDGGYIPPAAGHDEIVIHTGELARAEGGVLLVRDVGDGTKVAVISNGVRRSSRRRRYRCGCRWCN